MNCGVVGGLLKALATLTLLSGCQSVQTQQAVDVIAAQPARCEDPGRQGASGIAFLTDADWQAHVAALGGATRAALSSWQIGFAAGQSVALVSAGPLPNPGYRVSVSERSLPVRNRTLYVKAAIVPPPGGMVQAQVIAFPCVYLKLGSATYRKIEVQVE